MNTETILTEDNFDETYFPMDNHLNMDAPFDGKCFETYGEDLDFVLSYANDLKRSQRVWTILDCDGKMYLSAGYHIVNRFGYIITEREWTTGTEEFQYEGVGDDVRITNVTKLEEFLLNDANTTFDMGEDILNIVYNNPVFQFSNDGDGLGFIIDIWNSEEEMGNDDEPIDSKQIWFDDYNY